MKFEEKLQKLRKASNLSQEQLADKLNVSRQAVSKWESGASYPEMDKLIQMSKIFNCSLDDLVNDEETDKTIFKNQATKRNLYLDSFMEFITKSVNMFSKMKFINLLRCLCELIIIGFAIGIGVVFIALIIDAILQEILYFSSNDMVWEICNFLNNLLSSVSFIILIIIGIIIFIQIYKIRYLDYYDKLMYEYEQRKELEEIEDKEVTKEENKELKKVNKAKKVKLETTTRDRIIIRDPEHRPFAFLSILSKAIIAIFKGCLAFFAFGFVITLIFAVIALVISIYALGINKIFVGIIIGIIGFIMLNLVVLDWNFKFVHNMKIKARLLFIISIISICISSIGVGIFMINLKDIDFVEYEVNDEFTMINEVIPFDKNINTLIVNDVYNISLNVNDKIEGIEIKFLYNEDIHNYKLDTTGPEIKLEVEPKIDSIKEAGTYALDKLKEDKILLFDLHDWPNVEISGNKENIEYIVKTLEETHRVIFEADLEYGHYWIY